MAETTAATLPKGFRSAELGWPELHRIPHPPRRVPLIGDAIGANVRTPIQDSLRLGRQLGPIFRRRGFGKEIVFVWGADLAAELADESRFSKHVGLGVANLRPVAGDGLFTAYNHEPNWQLAHDVLAPGFSREAMEGYHPMMLAVTTPGVILGTKSSMTGIPPGNDFVGAGTREIDAHGLVVTYPGLFRRVL